MDDYGPPPHLAAVLRWSLNARRDDFAAQALAAGPEGLHGTKRLIEGVLYSRWFVPTYLIAIAGIIAIFTGQYWTGQYLRWRRQHTRRVIQNVRREDPASPGSNTTLRGTESPPKWATLDGDLNEHTLLLEKKDKPDGHATTSLHRVGCAIRSFLSYQPSPIPALTASANVLPTNATSLVIILVLALNVFYLVYYVPISVPMLFVFADRAGLCFVVNLPVLYVLAAKTNQPIRFLTGWSYEGLNIFHRRLGEWLTILAVGHSAGMLGVWYTLLRPLDFTLYRFLSSRIILIGILAAVSYLAIWITSTGWFRRLYYETFLGLHIGLQVIALMLLFFHHHGARPYVYASCGIWVLDRLVARTLFGTSKLVATLQIAEDQETVLVFCDIPIQHSKLLRRNMTQGWQPGQHVFLSVPSLGWTQLFQAHPFTIASPAPPANFTGTWPLQLIIRAQDGFSKQLLSYAKFHQHTGVTLTGPYGSLDALDALRASDRQCLVAGGSGIAVTYPLAWSVFVNDHHAEALISNRRTYQNGQRYSPSLLKTSEAYQSDTRFHYWIKSHHSHATWITMFPKSDHTTSTSQSCELDFTAIEGIVVQEIITHAPPTRETTNTDTATDTDAHTRPDVALDLREWVERHGLKTKDQAKSQRICIVVSGPDGLVRDVRNAAAGLIHEGWNIETHIEKFGW